MPLNYIVKCPACNVNGEIINIIVHLNNVERKTSNYFDKINGTHGWTFKQIGLWLKELGY